MGTVPDSMAASLTCLKKPRLRMQRAADRLMDFLDIRPRGAMFWGSPLTPAGPLSFMDVWDAMWPDDQMSARFSAAAR